MKTTFKQGDSDLLISDCHHAPVRTEGKHYACSLCDQPCGLKDWEGTSQDVTI